MVEPTAKGPKFSGRRALKEDPVEYLDTIRKIGGNDDVKSQLYPTKDYVRYATKLSAHCPASLQQDLARRFLAGITDTNLILRAQTQIKDLSNFRFDEARSAVIQQSRIFGRTSEFDHNPDEEDEFPSGGPGTESEAALLKTLKRLALPDKAREHPRSASSATSKSICRASARGT
ncbi:MAG: hypothetical protein M1826_000997 [Phylliscum demangeonii]|nr:MAG: hypothetical protein M1826_000997 [Phylliscum demangeonii]